MLEDITRWIEEVLKICKQKKTQIVIYVSTNVDSICCASLLSILFHEIDFVLCPIESNRDLFSQMTKKMSVSKNLIFILINCGGKTDIEEKLPFNKLKSGNFQFFLLDSHRPLSLANIFSPFIRVVSSISQESVEHLREFVAKEPLGESEFDGGDDDENEDMMDSTYIPGQIMNQQRDNLVDEFGEDEDRNDIKDFIVDDDDEDDDEEKRNEEDINRIANPVDRYYDDNQDQFAEPASYLAYRGSFITNQTTRHQSVILWLGIVGLTEYYLFRKIRNELYRTIYESYLSDVKRFLIFQNELHALEIGIKPVESEVKLCLYRHWNVLDSMIHSCPIVKFFQTWRKRGLDDLLFRIATMGLSKEELKKPYQGELSVKTRKLFLSYLRGEDPYEEDNSSDYFNENQWGNVNSRYRSNRGMTSRVLSGGRGIQASQKRNNRGRRRGMMNSSNVFEDIDDLVFSSFCRNVGMDMEVGAADMVYAIMSIMEEPVRKVEEDDDMMDLDDEVYEESGSSFSWKSNFKKVFDILQFSKKSYGIRQKDELKRGINLAINLQQCIIKEVHQILNSNRMKKFPTFNYVHLPSPIEAFQNKLGLTQLALFLNEILLNREGMFSKKLPLVLSANIQTEGVSIIIGIDMTRARNNVFSTIYEKASHNTRIDLKESFDSSIVTVKKEKLNGILEGLHYEYVKLDELERKRKEEPEEEDDDDDKMIEESDDLDEI